MQVGTEWTYKGKELASEDIPENAVGFIYLITNRNNGIRYIGKKLLRKPKYRMVNKRRKKFFVDSDWKDYWSSSPWLLEIIEKEGKENFTREILMFSPGKGNLNFLEEMAQWHLGVLESDQWYNSNIRAKIYKKNVMKYDNINELKEIIKILQTQK